MHPELDLRVAPNVAVLSREPLIKTFRILVDEILVQIQDLPIHLLSLGVSPI
jgi:hypothetical protein